MTSVAHVLAVLVVFCKLAAQSASDVSHAIVADLKEGKYAEANELSARSLKQSPNDARLWTLNGLALTKLNRFADALASFNKALQLAPNYVPAAEGAAMAHVALADAAFGKGACETGRDHLLAVKPVPGSIAATKQFGACLVRQHRLPEAVGVFRQISNLQPGNEAARIDLANVEFLAGNYNDTIAILTVVTLANSSNADALDLLAEAYEATLNKEKSIATLRQAMAIAPDVARYYVDFAYLCLAEHDFQQGIDMLNAGITRVHDAAPLYVARGILFSELAQYDKGESDFQTAERLNPNVDLISAARGLAELQENDLPKAEKTVRQRVAEHPNDAFLHYLLAEILAKQGAVPGTAEFKEAVAAASTAVKLNPNLAPAREVLGRLYLQDGKTDQAVEQDKLAIELNPNNETALYHLIIALRKANRTEQVPVLMHRLVELKQRKQAQADIEAKYALDTH